MKDDFYTFGGGHFWEDIFFYQKWRIQRNYVTKQCRLLDNWDICRDTGSFEKCRETFVKYIDAYQIARQKGHMIIMIHGLFHSKNIFKPLWRAALKHNFMAAAVNYPSSQKSLEAHVRQFHFFLNHLEDVTKVSFVTYGIGNIILQKLFSEKADWQKNLTLGRVVEVCPCLYGSPLIQKLCKNKFFGFIFGPIADALTPESVSTLRPITKIESGILWSPQKWYRRLLFFILRASQPNPSLKEIKEKTKTPHVLKIKPPLFNVFKKASVCTAVVKFLEQGKF